MSPLAAIALAQAALAPASPGGCAGLCDAERLRPVFARLRSARADGRVVRIVQIGDSHTAGDQVTGSWRALLQARYGAAGRGILAPGRPYQGYLTRGVTVSQSPGWSVEGTFGAAWRGTGTPVGMTGYSLSTVQDGASITLRADAAAAWFDRVSVCGIARPGAGTVTLVAGATAEAVPLARESEGPVCQAVDLPGPADAVTLTAGGGPVTLTSWATEARRRGGVSVSNLGTVGAQFVHWSGRTADRVVAAELAHYRPDLLVIAFGTNEAFMPRFAAADYQARLRAGIERLRRLSPGVPILLLGAPDSATRQPALQSGEAGVAAPCSAGAIFAPRAPLYPAPDGGGPAFPAQPATGGAGAWGPTAALASVQAIQQRTAHDLGLAYWNWSARMGGRCTAAAWATANPPLMRGDRVHFTTPGAAEVARRLDADWEAAMAADAGAR